MKNLFSEITRFVGLQLHKSMKRKYPNTTFRKRARRVLTGAAGGVVGYSLGGVRGAMAGASMGYRLGGSKRTKAYDGTTVQRDDKMNYRKNRMPKRKRVAWKKFSKKVAAVEIKDRGLQILKFKYANSRSVTAYKQAIIPIHLYGTAITESPGSEEAGNRDIFQISKQANTFAINVVKNVGGNMNPQMPDKSFSTPIRMQSAVLDLTFKNTGSVTLILEVYHIWYKKNTVFPSFFDANSYIFNEQIQTQSGVPATSVSNDTALDVEQRNVSLFDMNTLVSALGATVRSVREIQLPGGSIHKLQIRDPKNYPIDVNRYISANTSGYVDTKLTESYFVLVKNFDNTTTGSVSFSADRTYRYTVEGIRTTQSGTIDYH